MEKLRFPLSLPTSKNDFELAQVFSAEQITQKRAINLEIVDAYSKVRDSESDAGSCRGKTSALALKYCDR